MALKKEDLLKFVKQNELQIKQIEDDSSSDTEVKVLHLVNPVQAVGSNPTPDGQPMRVKSLEVYVAGENIEEMLKDCDEKDGILIYKGGMHLDVSKPSGRMVNGQFAVTKPSKIWLTKVKFSRSGGQLRQQQQNQLGNMISNMFSGGKVLDLQSEAQEPEKGGEKQPEKKGNEPVVVVNRT